MAGAHADTDSGSPAMRKAGAEPALATVIPSKAYLGLLLLAALIGIPVSFIAYGFLALVEAIQDYLFDDLPHLLFDEAAPGWWPVPWLALCGLLTGLSIRHLPGNGGHSPAFGFEMGTGPPADRDLAGIVLAALTALSLGAVLGPEAPLIAIGGGLAALLVRRTRRNAPQMAVTMMAAAGSFAAISTLLGSPLLAAFLIMEVAGVSGATLSLVALPGLLASGIGALIFIGMNDWTGLGDFSLAIPAIPSAGSLTVATLAWAAAMGVVCALLGWGIRWIGLTLRSAVHRSRILVTTALGVGIGVIAMVYQLISGHSFTQVLFSGQSALPDLVAHAADYTVGALILLAACKAVAYGLALSAFRGGPVFPALFIGGAIGIAAGGLPGLTTGSAIAMGIGAMGAVMLRLPLTSTLLATLLMGAAGAAVTPQVVIAVVVAFVLTYALPTPGPAPSASLSTNPSPSPKPANSPEGGLN